MALNFRVRKMVRLSARLFFFGVVLATGAHAYEETRDPWIRGVFTGRSPRSSVVAESEAWRRVEEIESSTPDAFTLVVGGESMQPLYPPGTILVLRAVEFSKLQSGQTAVYRNAASRAVAHVLVAKCRDGWRIRGLNNRTHDPEAVVAENFIGVVIAAFTPTPAATSNRSIAAR